jgi:hypothetical protein
MYLAIAIMAGVVALLVLAIVRRGPYTRQAGQTARTVPEVRPTNSPATDKSAADMVRDGDDPIEEQAKRVVDRENAKLGTQPPANAVGPDGRIHLRGGGSITREQWDEASKKLQNSPVFHDPLPPPPVN